MCVSCSKMENRLRVDPKRKMNKWRREHNVYRKYPLCAHYYLSDMFQRDEPKHEINTMCASCLKMGNAPPFNTKIKIKSEKQSDPSKGKVPRVDYITGKPDIDIYQCTTCNSWFTHEKFTEHVKKCGGGEHADPEPGVNAVV